METSDYYIRDNANIEAEKLGAAKGLYQSGDYKGALRLYLDMQNTETSHKLYYEIGRCYYKLEDMDNAELYFVQSVSMEKIKNPSYSFLGNIFYRQNNLTKAIESWMRAYAYKPDDESVCINLATSYLTKNMKFQSLYYYEKYLKYAKNKDSEQYKDIKQSIDEFEIIGMDFYKKAQRSAGAGDNETAIKGLEYAAENLPTNFDINYLLGKLLVEEKNYSRAKVYLLQAFCIDPKSLDTLQKLSTVMLNTDDYYGAYCCFKRMYPLILNRQRDYLEITKTISELEKRFNGNVQDRELIAKKYYDDNNYHLSLFEYENSVILRPESMNRLAPTIDRLKLFMNPESGIIKLCFEKGGYSYSAGDFRQANKYFSRVIKLAPETSYEYKFAKSRIANV